jgi:hypothetical protein
MSLLLLRLGFGRFNSGYVGGNFPFSSIEQSVEEGDNRTLGHWAARLACRPCGIRIAGQGLWLRKRKGREVGRMERRGPREFYYFQIPFEFLKQFIQIGNQFEIK